MHKTEEARDWRQFAGMKTMSLFESSIPFLRACAWSLCFLGLLQHPGVAEDSKVLHGPVYDHRAPTREPRVRAYEVVVYGGTPAGVTAAIQAARQGKKTVFLSQNQHLGGMTSGGLTATDLGARESIGGLAMEYYRRMGRESHFRPAEAEALFLEMLDEAGVTVLLGRALESVEMDGVRILSISMETGERIEAAMFLDTTYEGDLFAAAKVSYRVGREPADAYGESLGGQWQQVSWKDTYQFCRLPLSPYLQADRPESGLLPEISPEMPGKAGEGDFKVQAFNFRMHLSDQPGKIPFPRPQGYDPGRYALLARFLNADPDIRWLLNYTTSPMTDGPVQVKPGDCNNAGSFSSDYVGGNYRWPDGTYQPGSFAELPAPRRGLAMPFRALYELRERIFQEHLAYQQGLMYFLANNPQVPKALQARVNRFGLAPDAFPDTGHWPHQLYVREGRRMVSDYVMTQANCASLRVAHDSIGLASYPMDSHFCQRVLVEENGVTTVRNEGGFGHPCPQPYPVAYRSITPRGTECTNLLVPVCLSASHVAYGSIRMEPVFMILGQSAGTAAALAIDHGVGVQDLDYGKLKARLESDGQHLVWTQKHAARVARDLGGLVMDDTEAAQTGRWDTGNLTPVHGTGYLHDGNAGKGMKTLTFQFQVPRPGDHELKLLYVANPNRSTRTPVRIFHGELHKEYLIDQRQGDGTGVSLGIHRIEDAVTVEVSNRDTDGFVVVDGLQFLTEPRD
jgi:hypothetical protein